MHYERAPPFQEVEAGFGEPYSKEEQKNVIPWHPRTSQ
jgi:hypothetical protein